MYKMVKISAQTWKKSGIGMIIIKNEENKLEIWLKMIDIQIKLGVKNMSDLSIKEIEVIYNKKMKNTTTKEKQKYEAKATDGFVYILSDLALKIIMDCRSSTAIEFRSKLGFNQHDITLAKEQSVLRSIMDAFEGENIQTQYSLLG